MKKTICLYFQVHQPFRLRRYRFFDIGDNHNYFDDFSNKVMMKKIAERCYLPMNNLLLSLIKEYGKRFKVAFSITGSALEQFENYAPEVLASFKELAKTGCVEFLGETAAHSLAVMKNDEEFFRQVELHKALIKEHFGQTPVTFRMTELVYSDLLGAKVAELGFKTMLTEGAKHVLGWKSPDFLYTNAINPKLKVLLRNFRFSEDIAFRFSNRNWAGWPLTSEKFATWLNQAAVNGDIINLFMDYETFGEHQEASSGIFEFMRNLPAQVFSSSEFQFMTPAEAAEKHQPVAPIHVPHPISWTDEERDLSAWLGNDLQDDAFDSLYELTEKILSLNEPALIEQWLKLQNSDHFYYMCTKWFSDESIHKYLNPYQNPYDAYINYMNVISDFKLCVDKYVDKKNKALQVNDNDVEKLSIFVLANNQNIYSQILTKKVSEMAKRTTLADLAKPGLLPELLKKEAEAKKKPAAKKAKPAAKTTKKAAPAKKTTAKKAVPAKKTAAKPATKKAVAAKPAAKKTVAKKAAPAKKTAAKPAAKKTVAPKGKK